MKKNGDNSVAIVEVSLGDETNTLWNFWIKDEKGSERYLKKFRQGKARIIQSGGAAVPSYSSQQAVTGQVGEPENLSGSQTEQPGKKTIPAPAAENKGEMEGAPPEPEKGIVEEPGVQRTVHIPGMSERERIATKEEQARLLEEIRLSGAYDQIDAIRKIGVDPASVRADYGSEGVAKMNKVLPTLVRKGGMPLDVLAADHGFESADDLYDFVVNRYRPKKRAKEEQRVLRGSAKRRENFLRTDKAVGSLKAVLDGYLPKDAVESVESPKKETGAHRDLKAIGKELGFEVRFFESKHPLFDTINGLVGLDGTIYINTRSKYPILSVLGHEISHVLKTNHPDLNRQERTAWQEICGRIDGKEWSPGVRSIHPGRG
ncbi:MAG: hypothetical protein GX443_06910 [Deltaproteobacteria bacterium]|nr:hypothetical protein [Deltaproteobacteria bacterium]